MANIEIRNVPAAVFDAATAEGLKVEDFVLKAATEAAADGQH